MNFGLLLATINLLQTVQRDFVTEISRYAGFAIEKDGEVFKASAFLGDETQLTTRSFRCESIENKACELLTTESKVAEALQSSIYSLPEFEKASQQLFKSFSSLPDVSQNPPLPNDPKKIVKLKLWKGTDPIDQLPSIYARVSWLNSASVQKESSYRCHDHAKAEGTVFDCHLQRPGPNEPR